MSKTADDGELVYGSGNVFRDFGRADADVQQTKALLAARIIGILDNEGLSTRKAEGRTGVSHADFTRIRNVQLGRFTIDRGADTLQRLGDIGLLAFGRDRQRPQDPILCPFWKAGERIAGRLDPRDRPRISASHRT